MLTAIERLDLDALREFASWWIDDGRITTCCQMADDETLKTDPQEFNCDTCTVSKAFAAVTPENARAWHLFHLIYSRFAVETHSSGFILERMLAGLNQQEYSATVQRLGVLYDVFYPPRRSEAS